MNFTNFTNRDLMTMLANVASIFRSKPVDSEKITEDYIGLAVAKSYFYGIKRPDGNYQALELSKVVFDNKNDVTLQIEGVVKLSIIPTNIGAGDIIYDGYGLLVVDDTIVYNGKTADHNNLDNLSWVSSKHTLSPLKVAGSDVDGDAIEYDFVDTKNNKETQANLLHTLNGYYINDIGQLSGGGTFWGWGVDFYYVERNTTYRLQGTSIGQIATAVIYGDLTNTIIRSVILPNIKGYVDHDFTTPDAYCILAVPRQYDVQKPTKLYSVPIITCSGDSLTAGAGGNGVSYPSVLQELLGNRASVINQGVGGETTYTIAHRQGGEPMIVTSDFTLPADTTPVSVSISNSLGKTLAPLIQGGWNSVNPIYIDGISCVLANNGGNFTIARNIAGTARLITEKTIVFTNQMKTYKNPKLSIFFIGTNGEYTDGNDLSAQYDKMIRYTNGDYLIIGMHGYAEPTDLIAVETIFEKKYGARFINWRKYASTNAIYDAGLTPTEADLTAMGLGKCPPSLMSDSIHLTSVGYTVLGNFIYDRIIDLSVF